MNNLNNYYHLTNNLKIYIPSTINVDNRIDNTAFVNKTLIKLSKLFGGATSYKAKGAWLSDNKGLVVEDIIVCQSFTTPKELDKNIKSIERYCKTLKRTLKQEAISLEVNNRLYFI